LPCLNRITLQSCVPGNTLDRNVLNVEKSGGTTTSSSHSVWSDYEKAEERNTSGVVTQRFFDFGQSDLATNHLYNYDHLGSVREMTNSSSSVRAQYEYNLWGESVKKNGSGNASRRYAGYFVHDPSKLQFAVYRNYSASLGRWLRRDPIEENGGINLYSYVKWWINSNWECRNDQPFRTQKQRPLCRSAAKDL
jgi:RHS repeat-associated protein